MSTELNDKELFEHAIADTPPEPVAETPATPEPAVVEAVDTLRDEKGRFASQGQQAKAVETPPAPVEPKPDNAAHVPSWRLREVNDAKDAAERRAQDAELRARDHERQLAQLRQQLTASQQKPDEPVDFFADPTMAIKQSLTPIEQRMQAMQQRFVLRASRAEAISSYGKDTVAEMEKAIGEAMNTGHPDIPALRMQMVNSEDPVGIGMQWYQREKVLKETGGDVSAFKNKTLEEALKDPAFLAKAIEAAKTQASGGQKPSTIVQIPPSINRATSAASPHEESGDLSDRSLFAYATR